MTDHHTYDNLDRLTHTDRGTLNAGKTAITTLAFAQDFSLDQLGNWATLKIDNDGNGNYNSSGDLNHSRAHNAVRDGTMLTEDRYELNMRLIERTHLNPSAIAGFGVSNPSDYEGGFINVGGSGQTLVAPGVVLGGQVSVSTWPVVPDGGQLWPTAISGGSTFGLDTPGAAGHAQLQGYIL